MSSLQNAIFLKHFSLLLRNTALNKILCTKMLGTLFSVSLSFPSLFLSVPSAVYWMFVIVFIAVLKELVENCSITLILLFRCHVIWTHALLPLEADLITTRSRAVLPGTWELKPPPQPADTPNLTTRGNPLDYPEAILLLINLIQGPVGPPVYRGHHLLQTDPTEPGLTWPDSPPSRLQITPQLPGAALCLMAMQGILSTVASARDWTRSPTAAEPLAGILLLKWPTHFPGEDQFLQEHQGLGHLTIHYQLWWPLWTQPRRLMMTPERRNSPPLPLQTTI